MYEAKAGANAEREIMVRGKWLSHSPAWLAGDKRNLGQSDSPEWRIGVRRGQSQRSPGMHEAEMAIMNEADEASHLPGVALSRGLSEESTNEMRQRLGDRDAKQVLCPNIKEKTPPLEVGITYV